MPQAALPTKVLRIFISSPGDVAEERERARQVIQGLRRRYARHVSLQPIFWEDLPLDAESSFQQGIDVVLSGEKGIDVAIFILWARMGSPLGNVILRSDRSQYLSGTEREFELMVEARSQSGRDGPSRPAILCYRRDDDSSFDERLRGRRSDEQQELARQRALVEAFFDREFRDSESGANRRAFHVYDRPGTFSQRLRRHLIEMLDPLVQADEAAVIWDLETQGPPFVGLAAFRQEHADVFFGREEETLEARHALRDQAENGCAFLLLSGPSGSGKSSFAQAGIIPAIVDNEIDGQVTGWRTLVVTPSELAPNPIGSLVARICADDVFPELRDELLTGDFIEALSNSPETACALVLKPAFQRLAAGLGGALRLMLVVDQLEELFVSASIESHEIGALLNALEALARSGSVWIVATVRADFYEHVQAEPALVRMKARNGQLDILAPAADALRRMVEEPAVRAGLTFGAVSEGTTVADLILRDAVAHPELLPLIEDLLRELYERRSGRELTLAAYRDLGGSVEGALTLRAEGVFASLMPDQQAALGRVLELMVTHGHDSGGGGGAESVAAGAEVPLVRQWADVSREALDPNERSVIDAFVAARLFTAGRHPETGIPSAAVAHESLLRVWPRAVAWAAENRDFLRTRAMVARRMKEGSPLLDGDPLLGAARDHLARNPSGFSPELGEFIAASVAAADKARREAASLRTRRQRQFVAVAAIALLAVVGALVYFSNERTRDAMAGQLVAEAQRGMAERDYAHAEIAAARALMLRDTQEAREILLNARSGGVTIVGSSQERAPDAGWTAFSRDGQVGASVVASSRDTPPVISITSTATGAELWRITLPARAAAPDTIEFSERANGVRQIAVAWAQGEANGTTRFRAAIWALANGRAVGPGRELSDPRGLHTKRIPSVSFHGSRPWLATSGEDQRLSLWDYSGARPRLIWTKAETHGTAVHGIGFSRDGAYLASGGGDYSVKLWRVAEMAAAATPDAGRRTQPVHTLEGHSDSVFAVAVSSDGSRVASGGYDGTVRIWDLTLARPITIGTLSGHQGTVLSLAFSEDGAVLFSGGNDATVHVWDVREGRPIATLNPETGAVRSVSALAFDDDIRIGGEAGWSIWSIRGRSVSRRLWNGGATIGAIAFDPSGQFLAAGGNDGKVRIWDQNFRAPRVLDTAVPEGRSESINGIVFSADGRWMAAAGEGYIVHVWDRRNDWRPVRPADGRSLRHDGAIWGLCFDPTNSWLASANTGTNIMIRRWHLRDWSLKDETGPLADTPYTLACAPGGRLVSGDSRGRVIVRETRRLSVTGQRTNVSRAEVNVWSVAVTESPRSILSGNSDGRVRRWVPRDPHWTGVNREEIAATSDEDARVNPTINSVSYSQKHGWIAAGGDGRSVEIYDRSLRRLRSLSTHAGTVWFVAFAPDGARLAYGGTDRILRIFNLEEIERTERTESPRRLYEQSVAATGLEVDISTGRIIFRRRGTR